MTSTSFEPVLTKAALALRNKQQKPEFKALVFEEPKPTTTEDGGAPPTDTKKKKKRPSDDEVKPDENEFDIKKARHEILNFAMNNQRVQKNQKKMKIFQMVQLGAKPKKSYKNYKELLDERRRLKDIREERKKFHQLGKNQTGAASVKCRSKTKIEKQSKKRAPVSAIDQHYGKVNPKLKKRK
ncbi:uncharacterized protein C1orf131 [Musca vetustissima]|uniref:uncharacterized protein C1orf131 n=1 Tax=Musca vetustissima TaxID=27455 RepID=UPI002AB78771|nr:uncharacterized protein C1orf131 [Musca vetustissima]